jgi:taurine transport system substrate-binding protein
MNMRSKAKALLFATALLAATFCIPAAHAAQPEPVRLGWYGAPRIWVIGKAEGLFDKAMKTKVEWVQFASGASALTGLASRQVDIARMGSSPTVAGIARKLPIDVISVAEVIATSERLIAKSPVRSVADLKGKRIAYPPGSTAHYALMLALQANHVPEAQVTLISLAPADMLAAWRRGDIDAAYVWGPFSNSMEEAGGKQVMTTQDLQKSGHFIFNTFVVRRQFAREHPDQVIGFLQAFEQSIEMYRKNKDAMIKLVARHLDQKEEQVRATLEGLYSPTLAEQVAKGSYLGDGGPVLPALLDTGKFLVDLGDLRPADLKADFKGAIDTTYIRRAIGTN